MKKYFGFIILILLLVVTYLYREDLIVFYVDHFIKVDKEVMLSGKNSYARNKDFAFVKTTTTFTPENKEDLLNIYYTVIDSGKKTFSFYCPDTYKDCIEDVKVLANDQATLSHINNFVHPFNGFKHIETEYDSLGKVTIHIEKTYTDKQIEEVNKKAKETLKETTNDNMTLENKVKAIHDYIINNSKYDADRSDEKIVKYASDTAYGNLIEGFGLCGGYTDSMAIFLDLLGITNYKISSENHVWNALLLDGKWYHLDLTWDDPITTNGTDILEYNFFLINTEELQEIENHQHNFSKTVYQEIK